MIARPIRTTMGIIIPKIAHKLANRVEVENPLRLIKVRVQNTAIIIPVITHLLWDSWGLIEKAILNAKAKAENALEPLDYSITGVKAVFLSEFGMPSSPMPMFNMAYDEGFTMKSSSTSIFSSEQDVSTTANVIFTIGSN